VLTTLLSVWIIATVTRPLRRLTEAVAALSRRGLDDAAMAGGEAVPALLSPQASTLDAAPGDEFGQLVAVFRALLQRLREQWAALRRLDHFRREPVSTLSHDLRSPLTATTACLEMLEARWSG